MKTPRKTIETDEAYLRQTSETVNFSADNWKESIKKLEYYCQNEENNLAMASVQIGIPLRIIYLKKTDINRLDEDYNESKILINPKVLKSVGLTRYWEACASCLDYMGLVERPYKIELEYYDIENKKYIETFEGFRATVLAHELDHLDGILHIDISSEVLEMTPEERREFRKNHPYEIIRKNGIYIHPKGQEKNLTKKLEKK